MITTIIFITPRGVRPRGRAGVAQEIGDAVADQIAVDLGTLQPAKTQEFTANAERFHAGVRRLQDLATLTTWL